MANEYVVNNFHDAKTIILVDINGLDSNGNYVCEPEDALPIILVDISGNSAAS